MTTRSGIVSKIKRIFSKSPSISKNDHTEIEKILYDADLSETLVSGLMQGLSNARNIEDAVSFLNEELVKILKPYEKDIEIKNKPSVLMMVGVNGTGKTTASAKLAKRLKDEGKKVMLVAADTFRAAAVEQLEYWSRKINCEFFSKVNGADPGSVAYEGVIKAKASDMDVLIIDTGGRIHTQSGLMAEIQKVYKAIAKALGRDPDNVLLVVDSTQGQNIKNQAEVFNQSIKISGLILTKLDGTAKGGR
jgi:fused signal recognition particle receptor